MTSEDIIRMAQEAGCDIAWAKALKRFATLVAAAEREACAKVCEDIYNDPKDNNGYDCYYTRPYLECAAAIRARGQE
jgi:hypothetical protein